MQERSPADINEARIRPHLRGHSELLERRRMERAQAAALDTALADEPTGKPLPLRQALTKPGDPQKLRGIPVIARGVGGTSPGSSPEAETIRRLMREERAA